MTLLEKQEIR